jgi:hypothetical protein
MVAKDSVGGAVFVFIPFLLLSLYLLEVALL